MSNHIEIALPTQLSIHEQYAEKEERAIHAQRRIYEAKFPPPVEPTISNNTKQLLIGFAIIFTAAVIVSGAHTIPLFQRSIPDYDMGIANLKNIVGIAAFVMIEVAMIILTYSRIKHYTSTQRESWEHSVKLISRFIIGATILVFVVALFANVYSTLTLSHGNEAADTNTVESLASIKTVNAVEQKPAAFLGMSFPGLSEIAEISLFVLMGASAPVLTLLSGEIIGYTITVENAKNESKIKKWRDEIQVYNQEFNDYYNSQKGRGIWKIEVEESRPKEVMLLERSGKPEVNQLTPIKVQVDGKVKYECPRCRKVITRQAWQNHGCRFDN